VHSGDFETLAVADAPKKVVKTALRAARLIGNGLYGVDLKETPSGVYVIEVNDNPSIDGDVEDEVLGQELYRRGHGLLPAAVGGAAVLRSTATGRVQRSPVRWSPAAGDPGWLARPAGSTGRHLDWRLRPAAVKRLVCRHGHEGFGGWPARPTARRCLAGRQGPRQVPAQLRPYTGIAAPDTQRAALEARNRMTSARAAVGTQLS
jgi:hypothetical protein